MASNLACVGLAVADEAELNTLMAAVLPRAVRFGQVAGTNMLRWEDPSGARLVLGVRDDTLVSLLPSFNGDVFVVGSAAALELPIRKPWWRRGRR